MTDLLIEQLLASVKTQLQSVTLAQTGEVAVGALMFERELGVWSVHRSPSRAITYSLAANILALTFAPPEEGA